MRRETMDRTEIGKIVNAVGMKGEVKVISYSDDADRFEMLDYVYVDGERHEIENVRYKDSTVILKLSGICDRTAAEKSKNRIIMIEEEQLPELEEGQYYIKDIIGYEVTDESGDHIGCLEEVIKNSAQDIYRIRTEGGRDILVPGVGEFILEIDSKHETIKVRMMEGLREL